MKKLLFQQEVVKVKIEYNYFGDKAITRPIINFNWISSFYP